MTHVTKAALIPTNISWLDSGSLVVVSNDRGQIQCFDSALSLVRLQITMEECNPQRMLDLSDYFCHQQLLEKLEWAPLPKTNEVLQNNYPNLLMLHFSQGPLTCLKFDIGGGNERGLSVGMLTAQYVRNHQIDEAINLLVSLDWNRKGSLAMRCLNYIVNHLLKGNLTPQAETQMEACLGTFHVPIQPLNKVTEEEFGPTVRALTRRFFFKVLR